MTRFRGTQAFIVMLFTAVTANAMTFVPISIEDLARSSIATAIGTVGSVDSLKTSDGRIFTNITVVVDDVVRGDLTEPVITITEPGGSVGSEHQFFSGMPAYQRGEHIVVFLTIGPDGSLRTNHLALGKFQIAADTGGGAQAVQRFEPGTTVIVPPGVTPLPASMPLEDLLSAIERADSTAYQPRAARNAFQSEGVSDEFKFITNPPARFFEVDDGTPLSYLIDQNGDASLMAASHQAVNDAFAAWNNVPSAAITLLDGGSTADLTTPCTAGAHKVVFNDPDGVIPDPVSCTGILGIGGLCWTSAETKVVNGKTFNKGLRASLTMANGWGACPTWTACNFAEVATHELGHSIGLGHSADPDATMFATAHFDMRCAAVRADDVDGVTFIYPFPNPHDSVVLPVKPLTVKLAAGTTSVSKTIKVKVRNADTEAFGLGHEIQLAATSADCPGGTISDVPDFDKTMPGAQDSVFVEAGKTKKALVSLVISSAAFSTFNSKAPKRCTITFTANATEIGNVDPNPNNDSVTLELNVIDENDTPMTAIHESVIATLKPLAVSIKKGLTETVKVVKPVVVNADLAEAAHAITVTATDGTCPAGTVGVVDYDPNMGGSQNTVTVAGGKSAKGTLAITVASAGFTTTSKKSPGRCTAVLTATGPPGDTDPSNNTTNLVIEVIDNNDL
jgi:hypothetical protein